MLSNMVSSTLFKMALRPSILPSKPGKNSRKYSPDSRTIIRIKYNFRNSKMLPKASIIMPCYNHAAFLAESIESILCQSFGDLELIVVDDCSSDGSKDIIIKFAAEDNRVVPVFHELNGGEAKSRNDALRLARGDFIGFCDSDDLWEKNKLSEQINYFRLNPEIGVVHSDSLIINESSEPTGERFSTLFKQGKILEGNLFLELCIRNSINVPTVILRKKCISEAGFFEEGFLYLTDWIYWTKVAKTNLFGYINQPLARYRVHSGSTMHDNTRYHLYRIMGYKFLLERYYDDITIPVQAKMQYLIGVNYLDLNNTQEAQSYFREVLYSKPWDLKAISKLLISLLKTQEIFR